jgi:hypothetical protein
LSTVAESLRVATVGFRDADVKKDYVEKLPYATMLTRIGKGPRSLMVLAEKNGNDLSWIAADRTVLITRHGRILRTAGLPKNLTGTRFQIDDPLPGLFSAPPLSILRYVDFKERNHYGIVVESRFVRESTEPVTVFDTAFACVRYVEHNRCATLDWSFDNYYWLDARSGLVRKTVQTVSPDVPAIEMVITKAAV